MSAINLSEITIATIDINIGDLAERLRSKSVGLGGKANRYLGKFRLINLSQKLCCCLGNTLGLGIFKSI